MASNEKLLYLPAILWCRLIRDVRQRGNNERESGAFLLGLRRAHVDVVKAYACYDALDPEALDTGIISFSAKGFSALWSLCRSLKMEVLGDVHTHGDSRPSQSSIDRDNPMIPEPGHMAFILPNFAHGGSWRCKNVAIYEYLGNYNWHDWSRARHDRVRFSIY